jgi:ferredoxin
MVKRKIIKIDVDKCDGCGLCIPGCPEGALQLIDGKARLISDLFCDGLGACIGECPEGAITIEEREAEKYNEAKVMENIVKGGENVIRAHLEHLKEHGEDKYLAEALDFLKKKGIDVPKEKITAGKGHDHSAHSSGCPGAKMMDFSNEESSQKVVEVGTRPSELKQWPVQFHLISPQAPYFREKDVVLSADCVAYALGDFHKDYLKGKSLIIACPKLDEGQEVYVQKIAALIDEAKINTLTVMIMEVPCCRGLLNVAVEGASKAKRKMPIKLVVVGIKGQVLNEEWVKT